MEQGIETHTPTARVTLGILSLLSFFFIVGCTAKIDVPPTEGSIKGYSHSGDSEHRIRLSWNCTATGFISRLYSPTASKRCKNASARGEVVMPVRADGSFSIPGIDLKVTEFLSTPSFIIKLELLSNAAGGAVDVQHLISVQAPDTDVIRSTVDKYRRLKYVAVQDACIPANIVAVVGSDRFPFEQLTSRYPESREPSLRTVGTVTYRSNGVVRASYSFEMPLEHDRFCTPNIEMFVLDDEHQGNEELVYRLRTMVSAYVVYAKGELNPESGQRPVKGAYKDRDSARNAIVPLKTVNTLPSQLLQPIDWEIDISDSS